MKLSNEVKSALELGLPVVALESTIISHGMPYPKNVETALNCQNIIRENGAVPATIAIIKGKLKVGLTDEEINYLGKKGREVIKVSRRDIPYMVALKKDGATTVSATMIIANYAGIKIFATGGIGGAIANAQNWLSGSTAQYPRAFIKLIDGYTFENNKATKGDAGALYLDKTNGDEISDNVFIKNTAMRGGAVSLYEAGYSTITNNTFTSNTAILATNSC